MLQEYQQLKISEYQNLYDRLIPESHVLRKFNNLMDFSFVRDELEHKYCLNNGRNAISPVMLFKYLILKAYYCRTSLIYTLPDLFWYNRHIDIVTSMEVLYHEWTQP